MDRNNPDGCSFPETEAGYHAEYTALRSVRGSTEGTVLYVARVLKNDSPAMSKPCLRCQEMLRSAGVTKVIYTIEHTMTFGES